VVAEKDAFITALKGLVEKLEGQVGRYRHAKFGPKSEKLDPAQLEPALEGAPSRRHWFKPNGERKPRSPKRRRKLLLSRKRLRPARLTRTRQRPRVPRKVRSLPDHLPRVECVVEPDSIVWSPLERHWSERQWRRGCGDRVRIGEDRTERLDPPRANSPPDCALILVDPRRAIG